MENTLSCLFCCTSGVHQAHLVSPGYIFWLAWYNAEVCKKGTVGHEYYAGKVFYHLHVYMHFNKIHYFVLIVSLTKFLIVIGSPRAYLPRSRRAITWVSNYRYPIWTFCNWTPVIGYPRDSPVNCARFNGFLCNVSYSFQTLWNVLHTFSLKRSF